MIEKGREGEKEHGERQKRHTDITLVGILLYSNHAQNFKLLYNIALRRDCAIYLLFLCSFVQSLLNLTNRLVRLTC